MTPDPTIQTLLQRFKLPARDRRTLTFCQDHRPAAVAEWASQLPATRISNTSVLLYKALPEVVRISTSPSHRLAMLESLRPYAQRCIQGLANNFLNQPLILPEGAMKTAVIAQALQKHMSNGYTVVVAELLQKGQEHKLSAQEDDELSLALHRAVTGLGLQYLRGSQLYTPSSPQLWQELNALYLVAEHKGFLGAAHKDQLLKTYQANTIEQSYIRTAMLACAGPNQMRQTDLLSLWDALESWAFSTSMEPMSAEGKNLYAIDLDSDRGPLYRDRLEGLSGNSIRELDFSSVLFSLERLDSGAVEDGFVQLKGPIASVIYGHVREAWGVARSRGSQRLASHNRLDIVVGLSGIHYHAAERTHFSQFVMPGADLDSAYGTNFHVGKTHDEIDPWSYAPDAGGGAGRLVNLDFASEMDDSSLEVREEKYPIFQTVTLDASTEGYCLDWRDSIPANAKVGELLGIREQGRNLWAVGVIRWVRQNKGASQLGVQMLSPKVKPMAIKQIQKSGEHGDFMRCLEIPEFKAAKKPATLITPVLPFKAGDKVMLNDNGRDSTGQLIKQLFYSSAINQFTFRMLDSALQSPPEQDGDLVEDW